MSRSARIVVPGIPHHVTQRGNNRQDVFLEPTDYSCYLTILREQADMYSLSVLGYCLMRNHPHLIVVPESEKSLALAIGRTNYDYSQYFNRRYSYSGHLWYNRFYSTPMDETHTFRAMVYVERNPVRAHIVSQAWEYPWSSAGAHTGSVDQSGLLTLDIWFADMPPDNWREFLTVEEDATNLALFRERTHTGYPLGDQNFIHRLEEQLGYPLERFHRGRPRRL